jgi:hypothetical protein
MACIVAARDVRVAAAWVKRLGWAPPVGLWTAVALACPRRGLNVGGRLED